MTYLKRVALTGLAVAALLVVASTGGYTSVSADRGVSVAVAEDENALLGLDVTETATLDTGQNDVVLVELDNNLEQKLHLSIAVHDPGSESAGRAVPVKTDESLPTWLDGGESDAVTAEVACGRDSSETWTVSITARSTDGTFEVSLERSVTVDCPAPPTTRSPEGEGSNSGMSSDSEGNGPPTGEQSTPTTTPGESTTTATPTTETGDDS